MLSDEECREIWQTSMARCHPMNDISVAGIRTANAAYALGAERARVVKPLVWNDRYANHGNYRISIPLTIQDSYVAWQDCEHSDQSDLIGRFAYMAEAKAACQKHHAEYVLSMLEPV